MQLHYQTQNSEPGTRNPKSWTGMHKRTVLLMNWKLLLIGNKPSKEVQGLGFGVYALHCKQAIERDLGFRVQGLGFRFNAPHGKQAIERGVCVCVCVCVFVFAREGGGGGFRNDV